MAATWTCDDSHMPVVLEVLLVESREDSHEANLALLPDRLLSLLPNSFRGSSPLLGMWWWGEPPLARYFLASRLSRRMFSEGRQAQTIPMLSSLVLWHYEVCQPLFAFFSTLENAHICQG